MEFSYCDYVPDSDLKILQDALKEESSSFQFDIYVVGGLLKIRPKGVSSKSLLELDQNFHGQIRLYRHRSTELTKKYRGRLVSKQWVISFLKNNINEAMQLIEEKRKNDEIEAQSKAQEHPLTQQPYSVQYQSKKETHYGYDLGKSICPICNGDGGAAGQCYKCGGSGWA